MILLLGFKNYDEHDAEYQLTGSDARRIAAVAGHPGADKVLWASVTFFHTPLDYAGENEENRGGEDERGLDLFAYTGNP